MRGHIPWSFPGRRGKLTASHCKDAQEKKASHSVLCKLANPVTSRQAVSCLWLTYLTAVSQPHDTVPIGALAL